MSVVTKFSFSKETTEKWQGATCTKKNSGGREWRLDIIETLIIIGIFSVIGIVNEKTKPQEYYYENGIVTVYKKYQCPKYCETDHYHYVYYDSTVVEDGCMYIDKDKLGEKYKEDV